MSPIAPTTAFIIRHGERIDHVNKTWQPDPRDGIWDPPLSSIGHKQAEQTGSRLMDLLLDRGIKPQKALIVIYTSPFLRCVETAIGIASGMAKYNSKLEPTREKDDVILMKDILMDAQPDHGSLLRPILRLDLGLGEWMSDKFFHEVCPAQAMINRRQETLARRQAMTYAAAAHPHRLFPKGTLETLPPLVIDYGHHSLCTEFNYPESYLEMIDRFEESQRHCVERATLGLPVKLEPETVVVPVFVTHAIGVNALLDSFRNQPTRPVETGYCAIACVQSNHINTHGNTNGFRATMNNGSLISSSMSSSSSSYSSSSGSSGSDQSDGDLDEDEPQYAEIAMPTIMSFKNRWTVNMAVSNSHLQDIC
ncbi:histidine phosphatase superfamily [Phycomyces blakesleeanus]